MTGDRESVTRVGLVRVRNHCTFTWRAAECDAAKSAVLGPTHCAECIEELRRLGYQVVREADAGSED